MMKAIEIDGKDFNDLEGFYRSLEKYLHEGECPWGANLDSLDEIVSCNFNYTGNPENDVTRFTWKNFSKSMADFGMEPHRKRVNQPTLGILEELLSQNPKMEFIRREA